MSSELSLLPQVRIRGHLSPKRNYRSFLATEFSTYTVVFLGRTGSEIYIKIDSAPLCNIFDLKAAMSQDDNVHLKNEWIPFADKDHITFMWLKYRLFLLGTFFPPYILLITIMLPVELIFLINLCFFFTCTEQTTSLVPLPVGSKNN